MSVFDITVMHILEKIHSTTDFIFMISEVEGILQTATALTVKLLSVNSSLHPYFVMSRMSSNRGFAMTQSVVRMPGTMVSDWEPRVYAKSFSKNNFKRALLCTF